MTLISQEQLLENYDLKNCTKYDNKDAEQRDHSHSTLMLYEIAEMIEDAPVAYDAEKVVEEIGSLPLPDVADDRADTYAAIQRYRDDIIEIIKRGGVEDEEDI